MYRRFTVKDFSGGITDNIKLGSLKDAQLQDNFNLLDDLSLETREGYTYFSENVNRFPTANKVNLFFTINEDEFVVSGRSVFHYNEDGLTEILGDTGNKAFDPGIYVYDINNPLEQLVHIDKALWKNQMFLTNDFYSRPIKIYKDGTEWKVLTAGLPKYDTDPTFSPASTSGATYTYIYTFLFVRTYTVDDVLFKDYSTTHRVLYETNTEISSSSSIDLDNFQTILNGSEFNYGLSDIEVEVYRTIAGGQNGYLVDSFPMSSPVVITDDIEDNDLVNNQPLYTNGGVVDNNQPPRAKFVETVGDYIYWGSTQEEPYTVFHSKVSDPDSVPASFRLDFNDYVNGLSSVNRKPMVFTKESSYRLDGSVDDTGAGVLYPVLIDSTIGCIGYQSIVMSPRGVFFASVTGFAFSDGYRVIKISENFNKTYNRVTSKNKAIEMVGVYDQVERKVYWSTQIKDNSTTNDGMFVFYEKYGIKQNGTFLTYSGFNPSSIHIDNQDRLLFGDTDGYIYRFDKRLRGDVVKDKNKDILDWHTKTIVYTYISSELDFGSREDRKWIPKIAVRCKNVSDLSLQPSLSNDGIQLYKDTGKIVVKTQLSWGEPFREWIDDELVNIWKNMRDLNHIRYIQKGGLRAYTKQVKLTNAFIDIQKSDNMCIATSSLNKIVNIKSFDDAVRLLPSPIFKDANDENYLFFLTLDQKLYYLIDNTMTEITPPMTGSIYNIKYLNNEFIVLGQEGANSVISTTPRATPFSAWTTNIIGTDVVKDIDYNDGVYIVTSTSGNIYYSVDKVTWTQVNAISTDINAITHNTFHFVVVGNSGEASYSVDGTSWTALTTTTTENINCITTLDDTFVLGCDNGVILSTSNMTDFEDSESDTTDNITNILGADIIIYTTDTGKYGYSKNISVFRSDVINDDFDGEEARGLYRYHNKFNVYTLYKGFHSSSKNDTTRDIQLVDTDYWFDKEHIGYYLSFETDNYTHNYLITDIIDSQTLRIIDREDTIKYTQFSDDYPNGYKWIMRGIPKDEKVNILSYSLYYSPLGETLDPMSANTSNTNEE